MLENQVAPGFSYGEISEALGEKIIGEPHSKSKVHLQDLSHVKVLHYDFNGELKTGELIMHKMVAKEVTEIFYQLYLEKYPIQSIRPIHEFQNNDEASMAANNTSSFNYRIVAGTNTLSTHSKGLAIDLNPLFNPCVYGDGRISPKQGAPYANRLRAFPGKINEEDSAYKLFKNAGWVWGGNWNSLKDYQHFEKKLP